ncbi:MAG TPA: efflux RND transporter periplasmic adaptor subunit [Rubrivivax sp.]|jgi:RND family efflux transporter MFP subunit|nr:efflux RND transporter periplasmic adaptor subunit [Rubrivivax sp.]
MKTLLPALAAAGAILLLASGATGCSQQEPAPAPVRAVRTITVAGDSTAGTQEFAAEVRARTETRLGFRVSGKLVARPAEVGQHVKAGQLLAQLDAADLLLGRQAANAASRAAETNYELAAAEFKRFKELRDQGFISAFDLERREAGLKAQRAQLDQALAQANVQGNQAGYASLTASAAGTITAVEAEVGTVLSAGTPVLRIAHDGPRDALFAVPEDGVAAVRAQLGRSGALQVRPWGSTTTLPATVREVGAAADPATRTFLVKADIGNAPVQLGQTLTVLVALPRQEGVTKLPLTAVMQQQGQSAVWLVDKASMTVKVQPVTVVGAEGNSVVISQGLDRGQTVVTAGVHALSPGQKVKFYEAAAPTAQGPVVVPVTAR